MSTDSAQQKEIVDFDLSKTQTPQINLNSSSRRRHRPLESASEENVVEIEASLPSHHFDAAKAQFVDAINNAMNKLMQEHGFSRERATAALLRELSSFSLMATADVEATVLPVTDEQIFEAMKRYGLSAEQAMRALTVKATLERLRHSSSTTMSSRSSLLAALETLTQKLAQAKLEPGYFCDESTFEHLTSATKELPRVSSSKSGKESLLEKRNLHPRLSFLKTHLQTQQSSTTAPPSAKKARILKPSKPTSSGTSKDLLLQKDNGEAQPGSTTASRSNTSSPRQRSDSVAEEVSAKFSESTSGESNTINKSTAAPRVKRTRDEETTNSASASCNKRSRTNSL